MSTSIKLSVAIITYNEERNIGRCIESVLSVADDIVVIDSFSTDDTEKICNKFPGVRFLKNKFEGHIEQKNWALTQVEFPYVLSLDADEQLDDKLIEEIKSIKQNWEFDGYYMNRLTNYCGTWIHHCGWYPDKKLRIWDTRKGQWGGVNPHDKFEMYNGDKVTSHIKGDILHYSYYTREQHYKQVYYFTDILSRSQFKAGKKSSIINLILSPTVKFIRDYIIKMGFLDGYAGFTISRISAYATYLKYKKLRNLHLGKSI